MKMYNFRTIWVCCWVSWKTTNWYTFFEWMMIVRFSWRHEFFSDIFEFLISIISKLISYFKIRPMNNREIFPLYQGISKTPIPLTMCEGWCAIVIWVSLLAWLYSSHVTVVNNALNGQDVTTNWWDMLMAFWPNVFHYIVNYST